MSRDDFVRHLTANPPPRPANMDDLLRLNKNGVDIPVHSDAPSVYTPIHEDDIIATFSALLEHASVPAEERAKLGISDTLIRLSVGIEAVDDLIADLDQSL